RGLTAPSTSISTYTTHYRSDPAFRADWQAMDAESILAKVNRLSGGEPILVTLSGGNPALQPLEELLKVGHAQGHRFAMETQGSTDRKSTRLNSSHVKTSNAV